MSRLFYHVMQDNAGNLLFNVSGTMRLAGSGTLATIYGDEGLSVILPNPMTNHPSFGSFKCYLGAGAYDFYMAKSGYTFETLTGVQGHGTMAQQDAVNVAITGGSAAFTAAVSAIPFRVPDRAGSPVSAYEGMITAGAGRFNVYCPGTADNHLVGHLGLRVLPRADTQLTVQYDRALTYGITVIPTADTGNGNALQFVNAGLGVVGSISTTGAATAYNTSSDVRLKHAIAPLAGALDVLAALRPVRFRWNADDSVGHGFLAHEVQAVVPEAVTGTPDAVDTTGQLVPQQMDQSKLVPWLVGAIQELLLRVEAMEARLA